MKIYDRVKAGYPADVFGSKLNNPRYYIVDADNNIVDEAFTQYEARLALQAAKAGAA